MANQEQVKEYLAHWFQLGKSVVIDKGNIILLPQTVIAGNHYSEEFERCWQKIISPGTGDCHLEGTHQTIAELLSPAWEMNQCSRCNMPIAMRSLGMPTEICPCHYLPEWPNTEVPPPRCPVNTEACLKEIKNRLIK